MTINNDPSQGRVLKVLFTGLDGKSIQLHLHVPVQNTLKNTHVVSLMCKTLHDVLLHLFPVHSFLHS